MEARDESAGEPPATLAVLGAFAYTVLSILDLTTTTVLLRAYPGVAREANGFLADVIESHGYPGLWLVKLAGATLALLLYALVRTRSARTRKVADGALVACCVIQGGIVGWNLLMFARLEGVVGF